MRIKQLYLTLLIVILAVPSMAQKKKNRVIKKAIEIIEKESPEDILFKTLLPATAKVMFIDSMVVEKDSFLVKIPLNTESGQILTYQDFFNKKKDTTMPMSVYVNEFCDQAYYAEEDTINGNTLYRVDWLGENWGTRKNVDGIGEEFKAINYPFVMSDGITLFFAAKGEKSVGGYDIFTTTFDSESGKYYQAQNYGLPFNSKANDYFLAIDEYDNLGWLVSDRHQPEGKVCIYTFIPPSSRQNFEAENLNDTLLTNYANISSIKDTWRFGDRKKGMESLNQLINRSNSKKQKDYFAFVINDKVIYHKLSDFKGKASRKQFLTLNGIKASLKKKENDLQDMYENYTKFGKKEKAEISMEIIRKEQEIEQLYNEIKQTEKKIRNAENQQ